ncbi:hypothetical protein GY45DRAFT_323786 [Cubamyces sp. BRFM 1775]|nr:hypothetical protein GY45DRAFT_323786 [Cubamyces sp. BRFM 1775]
MPVAKINERRSSNQSNIKTRLLADMPSGAEGRDWVQDHEELGWAGRLPHARAVGCRGVDGHKAIEPSVRCSPELSRCPRIASQDYGTNTRNMAARRSATGEQRRNGNSLSDRGDIRKASVAAAQVGLNVFPSSSAPIACPSHPSLLSRPTLASSSWPAMHLAWCAALATASKAHSTWNVQAARRPIAAPASTCVEALRHASAEVRNHRARVPSKKLAPGVRRDAPPAPAALLPRSARFRCPSRHRLTRT